MFHPCGLRCWFGCYGWLSRRGEAWGASFLLYCFTKFLLEEAAWGNRVAISSDHNYLQVTENPSQSVLYKCLSILILFSHITRNPEVVWCLFSSADQSTTRHLVSFYVSVAPCLMRQFSSSSLTLRDCKMAINPSFPIQGRWKWEERILLPICIFKIWNISQKNLGDFC